MALPAQNLLIYYLSRYEVTGKQKQVDEVVDTQAGYRNLYLSVLVIGQISIGRLYRQDVAQRLLSKLQDCIVKIFLRLYNSFLVILTPIYSSTVTVLPFLRLSSVKTICQFRFAQIVVIEVSYNLLYIPQVIGGFLSGVIIA